MLKDLKDLKDYSEIDYIVSDFKNAILNLEDEGIEISENVVDGGIWKMIELSGKYKYNESNDNNRILLNYFEDRGEDFEGYVNKFLNKIKSTDSWRLIIQSQLLKSEKNNWIDFKNILLESVENLKGMGYRSFIMYKEHPNNLKFNQFDEYEASFENISEWSNVISLVAIEEISKIKESHIIKKFELFESVQIEDDDLQEIKDLFTDIEDEFNLIPKEDFGKLDSTEFRIKWCDEETLGELVAPSFINKSNGISIFGYIDTKQSKIDIEDFKQKWYLFLKRVQNAGYEIKSPKNLKEGYLFLRRNSYDYDFRDFYFSCIINI